jgi:hypothetical protein
MTFMGRPGAALEEDAMQHLRIEYPSTRDASRTLSIDVPDVATALVVAQINRPGGDVALWDGDRQIAVLSSQSTGLSPLWQVG